MYVTFYYIVIIVFVNVSRACWWWSSARLDSEMMNVDVLLLFCEYVRMRFLPLRKYLLRDSSLICLLNYRTHISSSLLSCWKVRYLCILLHKVILCVDNTRDCTLGGVLCSCLGWPKRHHISKVTVTVKGNWLCSVTGKVTIGLASHWPCINLCSIST